MAQPRHAEVESVSTIVVPRFDRVLPVALSVFVMLIVDAGYKLMAL